MRKILTQEEMLKHLIANDICDYEDCSDGGECGSIENCYLYDVIQKEFPAALDELKTLNERFGDDVDQQLMEFKTLLQRLDEAS